MTEQEFWAGSDESGKGDVFGSLVVAAVAINQKIELKLREAGIKDSKKLSDKKIEVLAQVIKTECVDNYKIIELTPEKYNNLYEQFRRERQNLNDLLAWGHSRVLLGVMNESCRAAIVDKFAVNENCLLRRLKDLPAGCEVIQLTHGEEDIAVAAASILARERFCWRMKKMAEEYKMDFPKGANKAVEETLAEFADKHGRNSLSLVAKMHFKTLDRWR